MGSKTNSFCNFVNYNTNIKPNKIQENNNNENRESFFYSTPTIKQRSNVPKLRNKNNKKNNSVKNKSWWDDNHQENIIDLKYHNIFYIDKKIKEKLNSNIENIEYLENELEDVKNIINNNDDEVQRILAKDRCIYLRKKINEKILQVK